MLMTILGIVVPATVAIYSIALVIKNIAKLFGK